MKKIPIIALITALLLCLTSCNYQYIDVHYNFSYAILQLPNGEIVEGKVDSWTDYEGEQLQVTINGKRYLVSSINCVLIEEV